MFVLIPSVCEQSNPCQGSVSDFMVNLVGSTL